MEWRMEELRVPHRAAASGSPDYILGKGRISDNAMEMEILPRSSWLGPREGYT